MVGRKIIYYPTIIIPSQWAKWAVLYFDKVSPIIPGNLDLREVIRPWNKSDFYTMEILMSEGELEPYPPELLLRKTEKWRNVKAFEEEFKKTVTSESFRSIINRDWRKHPIWRVHRNKVSDRIYEFLNSQGLAERNKENWNWILMEEKTSLLYMSLLAKYLADIELDFAVPGTDRIEYEKIIYGATSHQNGFVSFDTKLIDILPTPHREVSVNTVLKFKRKRRNELLHFREIIDNFYRNISNAENLNEIRQIAIGYRERIEREVENLSRLMKEENVKAIFGAFKSLLDIKSPTLLAALGTSLVQAPIQIKIPILGITAIIQIGYYWIDRRNQQRAKLRESPFAYLYYAQKERVI